jgi:hypothetical protein
MAYPLYFLGYSAYANPFIGLITATAFAILLAIMLAWLHLSTRSVWSSSLAHAGTNMVLATLSTALLVGGAKIDWAVNDLLQSVPLGAICVWIVLSGRLRADRVPDQRYRLDEAWVGSSESGTATRYPTLAGPI